MGPLGADLVDPPIVDTRIVVVANGLEAAIAYLSYSWVFDICLHPFTPVFVIRPIPITSPIIQKCILMSTSTRE